MTNAPNFYPSYDSVRGWGAVVAALLVWLILHMVHTVGRLFSLVVPRSTTTSSAVPTRTGGYRTGWWHDHSYDCRDAARDLFTWLFFAATMNFVANGINHHVMVLLWVVFTLGLLWIGLRAGMRRFADLFSWILIPFLFALIGLALRDTVYGPHRFRMWVKM